MASDKGDHRTHKEGSDSDWVFEPRAFPANLKGSLIQTSLTSLGAIVGRLWPKGLGSLPAHSTGLEGPTMTHFVFGSND